MFDWIKAFEEQGFRVGSFHGAEHCETAVRISHKHYPFFLVRLVPNKWLMDDQMAKKFVESTAGLYYYKLKEEAYSDES